MTVTFDFSSASARDRSVRFERSYEVVDALGPRQVLQLQRITVILLYHRNCALSLQFLLPTSPIVSCLRRCLDYFPGVSFAFMWFFALFSLAVPSQPPQNVRAITVTSDEAVITWSEPPRMTLNGVLKGYRVVFWSLYPDGGGCCGGQTLGFNQSNYTLLLLLPLMVTVVPLERPLLSTCVSVSPNYRMCFVGGPNSILKVKGVISPKVTEPTLKLKLM